MRGNLVGVTDPAQLNHLAGCSWMERDSCTCRTAADGGRYFTCRNLDCSRMGRACGGYCPPCFKVKMDTPPSLTFATVRRTNVERSAEWHGPDSTPWTGADWSNALAGEMGEAANVVKKLRRIETGVPGSRDPDRCVLLGMLADELADTFLYLDLLADFYDIDLADAITRKYNAVSEREGFTHRLPVKPPSAVLPHGAVES